MHATLDSHPTREQLTAYTSGKLSDADARYVTRHLETCEPCRRAAEQVPPDSFERRLRAADAPGNPPHTMDWVGDAPSILAGPHLPEGDVPLALPPELPDHPKYRVVRELGRGGMGVVYRAEHTAMERPVALKVITRALLDQPDVLERFRLEVKASARLAHDNIVCAYDAEPAGGLHLLVMEFVEGLSLAQVLDRKGMLPILNACHYARQTALGLQHAFEQGMVHRDIKPQNLMLTRKGKVKILDFGLARLVRECSLAPGLTQSNTFMGTPAYVAPEQAQDAHSADIRADIYSLGCTLYHMVAGQPPFQEKSAVDFAIAHLQKEPTPLHEVRADVPPELSAVVAKMLAKDPAQRYQTPVEVVQALAPFCKPAPKEKVPTATLVKPSAQVGRWTVVPANTSRVMPQTATSKPPSPVVPPVQPKREPNATVQPQLSTAKGGKGRHGALRLALAAAGAAAILLAGILIVVKFTDHGAGKSTEIQVIPPEKPPVDPLPVGSRWVGRAVRAQNAVWEYSEFDFELRIFHRDKDKFRATALAVNATQRAEVSGSIDDTSFFPIPIRQRRIQKP